MKTPVRADQMSNPMLSSITSETRFEDSKVVSFGLWYANEQKLIWCSCGKVKYKAISQHKKNPARVLSYQHLFFKIISIAVHSTAPRITLDKFLPVSCCCGVEPFNEFLCLCSENEKKTYTCIK
ncbi:hypothetical protein ILYODFUR_002785 [Ilyodon furcidens]|uniref:Uncharacterized protein n=1 Tax=Ilyodon furcidens TaxID=33524 RepID=A0ABV0UEL8_9TELE